MIRLIAFLAAAACWGQMAFTYGTAVGISGGGTLNFNTAVLSYAIVFVAPSATSVSGFSVYSASRATGNVDSIRAQIIEVSGGTLGYTVTYTDASDLVNLGNNSFANGDVVRFSAATTLPTGISLNTDYYVCSVTSTTFQIDNDSGCGSVVTDFSGSSGTQYCAKVIAASTTFTPSPLTNATWIDFSSFSAHTLTAGRKYAAMILNTEGSPGTDSFTIQYNQYQQPSLLPYLEGGVVGMANATTTQAFNATVTGRGSGYVELASGVKIGSPFYSGQNGANTRINGTREVGAKFTVPSNVSPNVAWIGGQILSVTGATYPTRFTYKLYSVGVTTDILVDSCEASLFFSSTTQAVWCAFTTVRALSAGGVYRLVAMATASAGDASNYVTIRAYSYRSGQTVDIPWSTAWTYCASSCTTTANWTNSTTDTAAFILGLDDTTPFASQGSGTGGAFIIAQ